jgi:hypothetical protein
VAPFVIIACLCVLTATLSFGDQILFALAALHAAIFVPAAILLDRYRRSLKIEYKLDSHAEKIASALSDAVGDLGRCGLFGASPHKDIARTGKDKQALQSLSNARKSISGLRDRSVFEGPPNFPRSSLGAEELFFLPDAALVVRTESVAALRYEDLDISNQPTRFVEEDAVPSDTKVASEIRSPPTAATLHPACGARGSGRSDHS